MASLQCGLEHASSICMMLWRPIHTLLEDTEINEKGINLMLKSNWVTIRYDVQHGLNLWFCRRNPRLHCVYVDNMTRPAGWRKKGDCPPPYHMVLMSAAPISTFPPWAGGGGVTWANFCWVCASGLLEPLPHYSLFCGHIIDPSLFYSHFGKKVILAIPF